MSSIKNSIKEILIQTAKHEGLEDEYKRQSYSRWRGLINNWVKDSKFYSKFKSFLFLVQLVVSGASILVGLLTKNISTSDVRKIVNCYNSAGFVIFELLNDKCSHENLKIISQRLKLGGPFVPNIYSKQANIYNASGFNIIKSTGGEHRAFQTSNEQKLHSDGSVEEIGKIKTSILLCVKPSDVGGETIIFNSVGAFYYLLEKNKKIAYSLFDENALRRVAVNGENEEYVGPVFSINDGNLNSRFSLDNTCDWAYGFEKVEFLKEAYNLLNDFVNPSSSFYISVRLKENQGIIMANNKISHGRKAYKDTILNKREMIRGLFEKSL